MNKNLRFTGAWPPIDLWDTHPNWELALDEEGLEGQDETTLRPSAITNVVDAAGAYTTGDAIQADGRRLPALIELAQGEPVGVAAFVSPTDDWMIRKIGNPAKWKALVESWLPEEKRRPCVSLADASIFPMRVRFRRPHRDGEQPREFVIPGDF